MTDETQSAGHAGCLTKLNKMAAGLGVETVVSADPIRGPYEKPPLICPHGTRYWIHPTKKQVEQWKQDGTP